ncbi:MAG: hypothetical protein ACP5I4_10965 [Oceanipulchritudo sp.]
MKYHQTFAKAVVVAGLVLATALSAAVRSSPNYTMVTDTYGGGGEMASSPNFGLDCSVGGGTALGRGLSGNHDLFSGYIAQLYEFTSLSVTAQFASVNEETTNQLYATAVAGDGSLLPLPGTSVTWTPYAGAIASINASGLALADAVYQNENATAKGDWMGLSDIEMFQVLNNDPDNYLTYGADGLPDTWQILHFGLPPNSDAGPSQNPDHDPDPNYDEWLAGGDPNDPADFFRLVITGKDPGTNTAYLQLRRIIPDRDYTLKKSTDLSSWTDISTFDTTVTVEPYDFSTTSATGPKDMYEVEVSLP